MVSELVYLRVILLLGGVLSANPWMQGMALFGVGLYAVAEHWQAQGKLVPSPVS